MTIAVALILSDAVVIGFGVAAHGFGRFGPTAVRFLLTCLLSWSLIAGWRLGRWIAISLLVVGAVISLTIGVFFVHLYPANLAVLVLGMIHLACAIGLLTPLAGAHFQVAK